METDGLKAVLGALHAALWNEGNRPTDQQISIIRNVIMCVFIHPSLDFDEANKLMDQLETAGLSINPPGFEQLASLLSDISI
jgi:hypothetical protein